MAYRDLWEKHSVMCEGVVKRVVNRMTDVKPGFIECELH